jgi:hypothetical protein
MDAEFKVDDVNEYLSLITTPSQFDNETYICHVYSGSEFNLYT